MFETIVWATDGSELADGALPYVLELARAHSSKIVAVHANELLHGRFGGSPMLADEPDLREKIEHQVAELNATGFEAELKVASGTGDTPELIARAADDAYASLIVVGTHGHGGFKSVVVGSVARGLLHRATCPLLAIPPAQKTAASARDGAHATVA
jgi:nucleotide-binding universal stress UspA family protein